MGIFVKYVIKSILPSGYDAFDTIAPPKELIVRKSNDIQKYKSSDWHPSKKLKFMVIILICKNK